MLLYSRSVPASIPDYLIITVPPGQVVKEIRHSVDGGACILTLSIGVTPDASESTNLGLDKTAIPTHGGGQNWGGELKSGTQNLYIKGGMRSVGTGGSHNLVVWVEKDG